MTEPTTTKTTTKTIVNSWNEWDPLRHVIVGRADTCHIPAPEPALEAKVPEDSDMRGHCGRRPPDGALPPDAGAGLDCDSGADCQGQ